MYTILLQLPNFQGQRFQNKFQILRLDKNDRITNETFQLGYFQRELFLRADAEIYTHQCCLRKHSSEQICWIGYKNSK